MPPADLKCGRVLDAGAVILGDAQERRSTACDPRDTSERGLLLSVVQHVATMAASAAMLGGWASAIDFVFAFTCLLSPLKPGHAGGRRAQLEVEPCENERIDREKKERP